MEITLKDYIKKTLEGNKFRSACRICHRGNYRFRGIGWYQALIKKVELK